MPFRNDVNSKPDDINKNNCGYQNSKIAKEHLENHIVGIRGTLFQPFIRNERYVCCKK